MFNKEYMETIPISIGDEITCQSLEDVIIPDLVTNLDQIENTEKQKN